MRIGYPKEIKPQEGRVGLTPAGVDAFVRAGHTVYMEQGAGLGSGFTDALRSSPTPNPFLILPI